MGVVALFTCGWPSLSHGQTIHGAVHRTVTDNTDAAIANATMTGTDRSKGTSVSGTTNQDGEYQIPDLIPDLDEGDGHSYEKGSQALIAVRWSVSDRPFPVGDRIGGYAGMPQEMIFDVVWISSNHGDAETVSAAPDGVVKYHGKQLSVQRP